MASTEHEPSSTASATTESAEVNYRERLRAIPNAVDAALHIEKVYVSGRGAVSVSTLGDDAGKVIDSIVTAARKLAT